MDIFKVKSDVCSDNYPLLPCSEDQQGDTEVDELALKKEIKVNIFPFISFYLQDHILFTLSY